MLDASKMRVEGLVKIYDITDDRVLIRDETNAVHFGNLAASIAESLSGQDKGHIKYMAFGNGGTFVNSSSEIVYRAPNTRPYKDPTSSLYNETFFKELNQTPGNTVVPITSTTSYADVLITCTLDFTDTSGLQLSIDRNTTATSTTFDEIALYTGDPGIVFAGGNLMSTSDTLLITHVTFHPIQKALNRILEINYTLRIHLE